jgi:hypothetical protein
MNHLRKKKMIALFRQKKNKKKPGYALKVLSTNVSRKGRVLADLTQVIEFKEDESNGKYNVSFR